MLPTDLPSTLPSSDELLDSDDFPVDIPNGNGLKQSGNGLNNWKNDCGS